MNFTTVSLEVAGLAEIGQDQLITGQDRDKLGLVAIARIDRSEHDQANPSLGLAE